MAIALNPAHKGLLHKDLGIPEGQPIPVSALMKAKKSKSPAVRKRANFAANARTWSSQGK